MSKETVEAEIVDMELSPLVILENEPLLKYDSLEAHSKSIDKKIKDLDLDSIVATEDNFKALKKIRADLNTTKSENENKRKMIESLILTPYNKFLEQYNPKILDKIKKAVALLDDKIKPIEAELLKNRVEAVKKEFGNMNPFSFVKFEDAKIKITRSRSSREILKDMQAFLEMIQNGLDAIDELDNKDRVLAKFQHSKDLASAIAETQREMAREKAIADEKAKQAQSKEEYVEPKKVEPKETCSESEEPAKIVEPTIDETVYQAKFKVFVTKVQLINLKRFLREEGITYESIK